MQLHYTRLPRDIKDHYIFLLDATVATGAAAMMAIRVLLDHDVPEEKIFLCSLLMAESGMSVFACVCLTLYMSVFVCYKHSQDDILLKQM